MVQWNTNSSGNGIWACLNLGNGKDAMLSVYRCIVTNNYDRPKVSPPQMD